MKRSAYGQPIILQNENQIYPKQKEAISEKFIQELVFNNAECLPISEIDDAYTPLIPVCMELITPVGPLDILMVTPNGKLVIIETKLWRNPEARRKVVAQILDYAKELSHWSYGDLQRELNKKLKKKGNTLYEISRSEDESSDIGEASFVDNVSRNLYKGEFLLLVVGDGIREGAEGISEFLSSAGNLAFSLSMIELAIYEHDKIGSLILPRVIAKTVEIQRMVVEIPQGLQLVASSDDSNSVATQSLSPELSKEKEFYQKFWRKFVDNLSLDDPDQALPNPANAQNLFLYLPPQKQTWISAYFMKSKKRVGVYFRCNSKNLGQEISEKLEAEKDSILKEIGEEVIWDMYADIGGVGVRLQIEDMFSNKYEDEITEFFNKWINIFVNVFRPRLKRIAEGH